MLKRATYFNTISPTLQLSALHYRQYDEGKRALLHPIRNIRRYLHGRNIYLSSPACDAGYLYSFVNFIWKEKIIVLLKNDPGFTTSFRNTTMRLFWVVFRNHYDFVETVPAIGNN